MNKFVAVVFTMGMAVAGRSQTVRWGPDLSEARMGHYAAATADGTVVLIGGHGLGFSSLATVDRIDVTAGTVTQHNLTGEHDSAAVARLPDGTWFVGGGSAALGIPRSDLLEVLDPGTGTVLRTGHFTKFRAGAGAAVLSTGQILVAGGWWTHNDAHTYPELIEAATLASTVTGPLAVPRSWPWVVPLADGAALVLGGLGPQGQSLAASPERYDPIGKKFDAVTVPFLAQHPTLLVDRSQHGQDVADCRLPDGRFVLMGMENSKPVLFTIDANGAISLLADPAAFPNPPATGVNVSWQHVVDRARGLVQMVQTVGNGPLSIHVTTVAADGSVLASGTAPDIQTGYYLHYSGYALLPDGSILISGGHERDNFTAVAKSLVLEPPVLAPSLALSMVPAIWITAPKGQTCTVQYSTALTTDWVNLADILVTNPPQPYVDLSPDAAKRFYRVQVKP